MYNIVWCDDKIDELATPQKEEQLQNFDCHLIYKCKNPRALFEFLRTEHSRVDAVIVDFNMNESSDFVDGNDDRSGFLYTRTKREDYPQIPFYLFSQFSAKYILEKMHDVGIHDLSNDYFMGGENHLRYFSGNDFKVMIKRLKNEVDIVNTPQHQIRQAHLKGISGYEKFGLDTKPVIEILCTDDVSFDASKMLEKLNTVRCHIESIFCKLLPQKGIFPSGVELNRVPNILLGKDSNYRKDIEDTIIEKPLAETFTFFLNLVQDGSHEKSDLKLQIRQYFEKTNDTYLYKSLALISLDLAYFAAVYMDSYSQCPFTFVPGFDAYVYRQGNFYYVEHEGEKMLFDRNKHPNEGDFVRVKKYVDNEIQNQNIVSQFPKFINGYNWEKL